MAKKSVIDDEKRRKLLVAGGVPNTARYDDKVPTNVRLERHLKEAAMADAKKLKTTLSEILNGLLREEYE